MKTKYIALFIALILVVSDTIMAQRIRKDHLEMTPSEKTAYVNALITLRNNGTLASMASHHSSHFNSPIHATGSFTGEFFLPWHRLFAIQMEDAIRGTSTLASNLTVPYWDWRLENTAANVTWDDAGFLRLSTLNSGSYTITRNLGSSNILTSQADMTSMLAIPTLMSNPPSAGLKSNSVNFFTYRVEYWHDRGHNFIGGTMGSSASPRDPIFFLHHNFVDKIWQDWYNSDNGVAKTDWTFGATSSSYWMWMGVGPNDTKDSRYLKYQNGSGPVTNEEVWYAYNKKLVLDGMKNTAFNVTGTKTYCYTAWNGSTIKGEIYAGDVKRDASDNIIADNRGGIKIKTSANCAFNAGAAIVMLPGFEAEYGSVFSANIVPTPCGFNSLRPADELTSIEDLEQLENNHHLSVYSEMGNNIVINYTLQTNTRVTLALYNMMGQLIYSKEVGQQPAGVYQSDVALQLANGVYICKLITDNSQESVKFVY